MQEFVGLVWNGLLDVLYPPCCVVCGARQPEAFCAACRSDIRPVPPPFCDRCGTPIPADKLVCARCEADPEPPIAWSQAMGLYTGTLRHAIHRLKYDGKTALALPLGRLLAHSLDAVETPLIALPIPEGLPAFDVVVPVPLHPARLRKRGFNQAEKIARSLCYERGWPLDADGLRRTRQTHSQTTLAIAERAANVQGAFVARTPQHFAGQSVLLVDDVLTTGATAREAARAIREAGATRVCMVALAQD